MLGTVFLCWVHNKHPHFIPACSIQVLELTEKLSVVADRQIELMDRFAVLGDLVSNVVSSLLRPTGFELAPYDPVGVSQNFAIHAVPPVGPPGAGVEHQHQATPPQQ